jgi:hypothetical protein
MKNKRSIPQFTAQSSLFGRSDHCHSLTFDSTLQQKKNIIPQLPQEGAPGLLGCIHDCRSENPTWKLGLCRKVCAADSGLNLHTERGFWDTFLSNAGISLWEGACKINPFTPSFLCSAIANEIRRQS